MDKCSICGLLNADYEVYCDSTGRLEAYLCKICEPKFSKEGMTTSFIEETGEEENGVA